MVTKVQLQVNYATRRGSREVNEDFFIVLTGDQAPCGTMGLVTVADGIGGQDNGAEASRLALKTVADVFAAGCSIASGTMSDVPHLLRFAAQKANAAVFQAQMTSDHLRGMGCTVVAAAITGDSAHVISVGDSRAYLFHNGQLTAITEDEWVKMDDGLTLVSRAVGWQPLLPTEPITQRLTPGDILLLCTDGLTDSLTEEAIADTLQTAAFDKAADILAESAASKRRSDNVTVVMARVG
jgi:serine/threonine protein phosphatase PrpC